jgi:hypothetical protein
VSRQTADGSAAKHEDAKYPKPNWELVNTTFSALWTQRLTVQPPPTRNRGDDDDTDDETFNNCTNQLWEVVWHESN